MAADSFMFSEPRFYHHIKVRLLCCGSEVIFFLFPEQLECFCSIQCGKLLPVLDVAQGEQRVAKRTKKKKKKICQGMKTLFEFTKFCGCSVLTDERSLWMRGSWSEARIYVPGSNPGSITGNDTYLARLGAEVCFVARISIRIMHVLAIRAPKTPRTSPGCGVSEVKPR